MTFVNRIDTRSVPRRMKDVADAEQAIGARIAALRTRRSMTQIQLAAKLGMSQSLLSRYERGVLRIHGALVAEIASALVVSADEILGLTKTQPKNGDGVVHERRIVRRIQKMEQLPKRKKEALITTIDAFLRDQGVSRS